MKVEIFALCDYASTDASGKVNLLGIFDFIAAPTLPVTLNLCAVVARFRFTHADEGVKSVKITLVDKDGEMIMPALETQIPVRIASDTPTATAQVVSTIMQLRLPNYGEYTLELTIDGRQETSCPLYVFEAPAWPTHPLIPPT